MSGDAPRPPDWAAVFRAKIGANVRGWHDFVAKHEEDHDTLAREFRNIEAALQRGFAEPSAWDAAVELALDLYPYVDRSGRWLGWPETIERALAASRLRGDRRAEMRLMDQAGTLALVFGEAQAGLRSQEAALQIARETGDRLEEGRIIFHLGRQHEALNEFESADACAADAEAIFRETAERRYLAHTLVLRGMIAERAGRLEPATGFISEADALYEALADRRNRAYAIHNLGNIYRAQHNPVEAGRCFMAAEALYREHGLEIEAARSRMHYGITLHTLGETERALLLHREVEAVFERVGDRYWLPYVLNNEGVFLTALGRTDEAMQALVRASDLHRANANPGSLAGVLLNRTELLLDLGRGGEALELIREVDEILAALSTPPAWVARARKELQPRLDAASRPA